MDNNNFISKFGYTLLVLSVIGMLGHLINNPTPNGDLSIIYICLFVGIIGQLLHLFGQEISS